MAVGSGPYVIDKFEFGKFITYKRNPNWWAKNLAKTRAAITGMKSPGGFTWTRLPCGKH